MFPALMSQWMMPSLYACSCAVIQPLTFLTQTSRLPQLTSKNTGDREHEIMRPRTEIDERLSDLLNDDPIVLMFLEWALRFTHRRVIFVPQRSPIGGLFGAA